MARPAVTEMLDTHAPSSDESKASTSAGDPSPSNSTYESANMNDDSKQAMPGAAPDDLEDDSQLNILPLGWRLFGIVGGLMLGVFCMALDNTIIAVAIPRITTDFHDLNDVGWYASAYLLPGCAFQLLAGKLYTYFNMKWIFLGALFVFEVGSLVCAVAPTSTALIVGRAVAGLGSAAIFTGALITIAHITTLEKRPLFFSAIGGVYGLASVVGPLLGGAFTQDLSWRGCFYINLPIGGVAAVFIVFFLHLKRPAQREQVSWRTRTWSLDPIGNTIFVPAIVCLLIALQWGGITYPWSNGRIIALFVVFALGLIAFCVLQWALKDNATVPLRVAKQRSIAFAALFGFCIGASFFVYIYYIPIWFQAIKGTSPVKAGIYCLPLILAEIFAIALSGGLVTKLGYFAPFFIASSVLMSIGAGLIMLFNADTSTANWVGFQFLYGFGVGLGFQQGGVAAQAVLPFKDVAVGTAVVLFLQILGGALFVSVAQNLFTTQLIKNLVALNIPGLDAQAVVSAGATGLRSLVDVNTHPEVLAAYNDAIIKSFEVGLITACISIIGAVGIEWKSVKNAQQPQAEKATESQQEPPMA